MANVIVDATRTAIGSFGGSLKGVHAPDLGAHCIKTLIERNGIEPASVDEVIMGMVVPAGVGQIPSRQASVRAGLPVEVSQLAALESADRGHPARTDAVLAYRLRHAPHRLLPLVAHEDQHAPLTGERLPAPHAVGIPAAAAANPPAVPANRLPSEGGGLAATLLN